jgi:hypothetical protein
MQLVRVTSGMSTDSWRKKPDARSRTREELLMSVRRAVTAAAVARGADTDSLALVYLTPDCSGPVQVVSPGEFTRLGLPFAGSVMFVTD